MKARFLNFIILSATFFLFSHLIVGQVNIGKPKNVDYCSIFDLSNNYSGQIIKSRAFMTYSTVTRVDGGDSFLYSKNCNNGDYFAVTNFSKLNNLSKWEKFFAKLPGEKNFIFEISFIGKLQTSVIPFFGHLGWSRAEIEIFKIESMKDITSVSSIKNPDYKTETPLREKGQQLMNVNNQVLFFFVGSKKDREDIDNLFADEFILIGTFGNVFKKNNYKEIGFEDLFSKVKDFDNVNFEITEIKVAKENYEVYGVVSIHNKNRNIENIKYKNVFLSTKDSWLLTKTEFSKL